MRRVFRLLTSLALAAAIIFGAPARAADTTLDPPFGIEVTGGADSHGEIVFSFSEDGVEIIQIAVPIPKGTPENAVARRIRKELRRALSKDQYSVDVDGGETILLSAKGHAKRFVVRLVRNTVDGTQIRIARE